MSGSLAAIRQRGYNAARDNKPRHCALKNHKHRDMWYDGYDCFKDPSQPPKASPEKVSAEISKLKQLLEQL
jgi:hypothetical protein